MTEGVNSKPNLSDPSDPKRLEDSRLQMLGISWESVLKRMKRDGVNFQEAVQLLADEKHRTRR